MAKIQELTLAGHNRILLLLAVGAGLVAAVLVFVALNNSSDDSGGTAAGGDAKKVLLATEQITAGTLITEEMLELRDVPDDLVLTGSYTDSELVVGENAKITIAQGEQVTRAKIGLAVPEDGLSGVVPAGMRAVAIEVEEVTAVGGLLLPGDRVDVVAVTKIERAPGLAEDEYILRTETILQDVEILSVAQEAQEPAAGSGTTEGTGGTEEDASYTSGRVPENPETQENAGTVTVSLTPADALKVVSFQEFAVRIWAVERAFGDKATLDTAPVEVVLVDD